MTGPCEQLPKRCPPPPPVCKYHGGLGDSASLRIGGILRLVSSKVGGGSFHPPTDTTSLRTAANIIVADAGNNCILGEELEKLAAFEAQSSTVRKTITNHTSASTATSTARCGSNNARNNRINSCSLVMSPPCSSAPDHCIYQTSQLAAASLLHLHKDLNEVGFAS